MSWRFSDRAQVFDENGTFLDQWSFGDAPSDVHMFNITSDGYLWAADRGTNRIVKYDLNGNFLYSWGTWGDFPGGMWGVHGMSTDQDGNVYVAERGVAISLRVSRRKDCMRSRLLVAAAIGNAIFDATGARIRQVPFTAERVLPRLNRR